MNINIAILEDNPSHFEQLSGLIDAWALKNRHSVCINWFQNGFDMVHSDIINKCDLLFSDIKLQKTSADLNNYDIDSNGINACSQLRKNGFHGDIIFLTAFREYVFDGYQVQAINYLLKPISEEAVDKCLDNFLSMHCSDFLYLHKNNDIIRIPYNDIISVSRNGHECCINTISDLYIERTSLKSYETRLPKQFLRCHKSCIVNLNHITALSGSTIRLSNKQSQTAGRLYLDTIKKALLKMATDNHV